MLADRAELVAAYDVSNEALCRFDQQFHVGSTYLELERMLGKDAIDIVVISTLGLEHAKAGETITNSEKVRAVLCEKPFTQIESEAVGLVEAAKETRS